MSKKNHTISRFTSINLLPMEFDEKTMDSAIKKFIDKMHPNDRVWITLSVNKKEHEQNVKRQQELDLTKPKKKPIKRKKPLRLLTK